MRVLILLASLTVSILSCNSQELSPREGYIQVEGGRIWYKLMGSGNKTPLLLIHGGPGGKSCSYISTFKNLSEDRPVILYDQLGTGLSDRPTDTTLWRLPRFVNEIDSIRAALGLKKLHIMGQSWGGSVLIEYLATKNTTGIQSAIFASPLISTPAWMEDAKILLAQMPKNLQDTILKYEALKAYESPAYTIATDSFYARHMSRKQWPRTIAPDCEGVSGNSFIYNYMWGSTEFNATGTLKHFDRTPALKELDLPVLFITGQYDEARPETMTRFHKMVKQSKLVIIENAGHAIQTDQPEQFTRALRQFLESVD